MNDYRMRVSAKGFFFNGKGELLIIRGTKEGRLTGYWSAPGGGVEEGESIFAAVERELLEETGFSGKASSIVFIQDYDNPKHGRNLEVFAIGEISGKPKIEAVEEMEFRFVSKEEYAHTSFMPADINPFELKDADGISYKTYLC